MMHFTPCMRGYVLGCASIGSTTCAETVGGIPFLLTIVRRYALYARLKSKGCDMSSAVASFSCGACGRSFAWKNEYAGKTLKCKCGQPIKAPSAAPVAAMAASPPAAPLAKPAPVASQRPGATAAPAAPPKPAPVPTPAAQPDDDFAKLVSEAEYELAAAPAPAPATRKVTVAPMLATAAAAAGPGGPTSPMLGYAGVVRKPPPDQSQRSEQIYDVYVPLVLLVAAVIAYFIDGRLQGISNPIILAAFVLIKSVVNATMVLASLLIAVKLIDLGLGRIGPALMKAAAIALLPAALGEILGMYTSFFVPWILTILLYFGLMKFLFDLDLGEILIVTGIMWVVQTWLAMLLIGLLLTVIGAGSNSHVGAVAAVAFSTPAQKQHESENPTEFPASVEDPNTGDMTPVKPADVDQHANDLLTAGKTTEAKLWLDDGHHICRFMQKKAMQMRVDQIYQAGAKKVYIAGVETVGPDDFASQYLIELPDDPAARKTTLKMADDMNQAIKPTADDGRKFIVVPVD